MEYKDEENLSIGETPKHLLPWYCKIWAYPLSYIMEGILWIAVRIRKRG